MQVVPADAAAVPARRIAPPVKKLLGSSVAGRAVSQPWPATSSSSAFFSAVGAPAAASIPAIPTVSPSCVGGGKPSAAPGGGGAPAVECTQLSFGCTQCTEAVECTQCARVAVRAHFIATARIFATAARSCSSENLRLGWNLRLGKFIVRLAKIA